MLKRVVSTILPLVFVFFLLASCQKGQEAGKEEDMVPPVDVVKEEDAKKEADSCRFSDSNGYMVEVHLNPKRVAVLFSSFADIWVDAGGQVAITVGEAIERGFADDTAILVDDGAGKTIDIEALIAAEPDFVICSADIPAQTEAADLLREAGIPCAQFRVECFDDYLEVLKICTNLTGDSEAYQKYGTEVQQRVQEVLSHISKQQMEEDAKQKRVLFIRSGSGASSAKAKTAEQHFAAAMLEELGAYNIADNAPVLLDGLSIEEILREDPDVIFISTMGEEEAAKAYMDSVLADETWQALSAVCENRCYYLPKDLFQFKPNAKWDEAYGYLADLLYPDDGWNE